MADRCAEQFSPSVSACVRGCPFACVGVSLRVCVGVRVRVRACSCVKSFFVYFRLSSEPSVCLARVRMRVFHVFFSVKMFYWVKTFCYWIGRFLLNFFIRF